MLRKWMQSVVYARMLSAYHHIPHHILVELDLADPQAQKEQAYKCAYGV